MVKYVNLTGYTIKYVVSDDSVLEIPPDNIIEHTTWIIDHIDGIIPVVRKDRDKVYTTAAENADTVYILAPNRALDKTFRNVGWIKIPQNVYVPCEYEIRGDVMILKSLERLSEG